MDPWDRNSFRINFKDLDKEQIGLIVKNFYLKVSDFFMLK